MKTMTCKELGGPCDLTHRGENANEKGRWKHPIAGMGWYRKARKDFANLPEG